MTTRRLSALQRALPVCAVLALAALAVSGCGGSSKASAVTGAAGTDGRAAQAFPATTVAFADANIDASSDAWKKLLAVGARFPSWPKLVAKFDKEANDATGGGPTLAQVRAWLGSEVAVGVLDVPAAGTDPQVLGFAEVRDRGSLEAALKSDKTEVAAGTHGGFDLFKDKEGSALVAISDDTALASNSQPVVEAAIDRLAGTGDNLAGVSAFTDTLAGLADDNVVVGYAPGSVLQKLVTLARNGSGPEATRDTTKAVPKAQFDQISAALANVRSLGFSLGATDNGVRTRWVTLLNGDASSLPQEFTPDLLDRVPANSWFAATFGGSSDAIKSAADKGLGSNPQAKQQVSQLEAALGVKLDDIYALLSGDQALFAGPGAPLSAGLILHPSDAAKGATTLRALTKLLASQGIAFTDTADGQSAAVQGFAVRWRAVDDVLGIGTDETVGDKAKDSILESDKFKRVLGEDGVDSGSKTLGLAYVDVPSLVNLATAFGAFKDADQAETLANLKHVGGVLVWSGRDGSTVTTDLFVEST